MYREIHEVKREVRIRNDYLNKLKMICNKLGFNLVRDLEAGDYLSSNIMGVEIRTSVAIVAMYLQNEQEAYDYAIQATIEEHSRRRFAFACMGL